MSQDRPDILDLLRTVRDVVDRCAGALTGDIRYDAQVASYLLAMCEREIQWGSRLDEEDQRRMAAFLGTEGAGPTLKRALCTGIRSGRYDAALEEVAELVLAQTVDKLTIVRPDRLAGMHHEAALRCG